MPEQGTFLGEAQRGWNRFWASGWKVKGPVLGVVALVALAGLGGALSGGDDDATVQAEPDGETATATETEQATPTEPSMSRRSPTAAGATSSSGPTRTPAPTNFW